MRQSERNGILRLYCRWLRDGAIKVGMGVHLYSSLKPSVFLVKNKYHPWKHVMVCHPSGRSLDPSTPQLSTYTLSSLVILGISGPAQPAARLSTVPPWSANLAQFAFLPQHLFSFVQHKDRLANQDLRTPSGPLL